MKRIESVLGTAVGKIKREMCRIKKYQSALLAAPHSSGVKIIRKFEVSE